MQRTKVTKADGNTEWVEVWRLYMTVAGRVAMVQKACEVNGWNVDFSPEANVPENNPAGFLFTEPSLVYREYCNIYTHDGEQPIFIGSKPGMSMGKQGNNAYEKLETSARGRAIAAWGFGVLPGSGIASLEEMESVKGTNVGQKLSGAKRTKGQILTSVNDLMGTLEKLMGEKGDTIEPKILGYVKEHFGKETIGELAEGQLIILERKIRANIAQESQPVGQEGLGMIAECMIFLATLGNTEVKETPLLISETKECVQLLPKTMIDHVPYYVDNFDKENLYKAMRIGWCESRGKETAYRKSADDSGVMQFIPSTWNWIAEKFNLPEWDKDILVYDSVPYDKHPRETAYDISLFEFRKVQYVPYYNIKMAAHLAEDTYSKTTFRDWNSSK